MEGRNVRGMVEGREGGNVRVCVCKWMSERKKKVE